MKTLTNLSAVVILMIAIFSASTSNAQEWTKAQKEVWKSVENGWAQFQKGDLDAFFASVHQKYMGWSNMEPLPASKEKWFNSSKELMKHFKFENYDIEPARILVYDNVAVVDYYYEYTGTDTKNDKTTEYQVKGKYVAFLIKEGGKWMLIGDMTCRKPVKQ